MTSRLTIPVTLVILACMNLVFAASVSAQGMITPRTPEIDRWMPPYGGQPFTLERESIQVRLDDQFAHIETSQLFRNNTGMDLEGTWIFPVPTGAGISDFSLWLDGNELRSETMEANQAATIYHQIVSSMRDPGLLEYMGDGLIRANIYPIPANGTKQIDMQYDWLVPIDSDLMKLEIPLRLEGYSVDEVRALAITIEINSPDTLGTIYSPTHDVNVSRSGSQHATVSIEKSAHRPQDNFILYISRPEGPVGLNFLTHATGTDEGYFLAMIAPEYDESRQEVVPKDFVLVLDISGSMVGDKLEQAKAALSYIFQNLNSSDRFQFITFATDVYPYFEGWSDATRSNITDVAEYVSDINAGGSTNIDAAMRKALESDPGPGRPMYIIFLTDGLPTVGETNTDRIVDDVNAINSRLNARVFCFGVGQDVDYEFIDRMSRENGGYTKNVAPDENLEGPLSDFYSKIKSPVMTGIEIDISGTRTYDLLPVELPDLFLGGQLILTGRFVGHGEGQVRLTGTVGAERMTYNYPVSFTGSRDNDFIPRHWATRRVGYLLNEIRIYGENREVIDEIVDLATRYGIITPYTSMLVTENETQLSYMQPGVRPGGPIAEDRNWLNQIFSGGASSPSMPGSDSSAMRGMAASEDMAAMESLGYIDGGDSDSGDTARQSQQRVRYAGDKTFYLDPEGFWIDSIYIAGEHQLTDMAYMGEEYLELIADDPDVADYLAVGEKMILVLEDRTLRIAPDGEVDPDAWDNVIDDKDDEIFPDDETEPAVSKKGGKSDALGYTIAIVLLGVAVFAAYKLAKR